MTYKELSALLRTNKVVCVLDNFYEVAVKFTPADESYTTEIKHKGRTSAQIPRESESVIDTIMNGEVITEKEYDEY